MSAERVPDALSALMRDVGAPSGVGALGYGEEADRIVTGLGRAALRDGFREYYDPRDGEGLAARGFGWSTLLVDLL